jgi:hypothetical protein
MLIDKYGRERGERTFDGLIDAMGSRPGAFFAAGGELAAEKAWLINTLNKPTNHDYWQYNYYELWKEWRKQLRYGECPTYRMDGMGMFALRLGKSKAYLRKLVSDMRRLKGKYPDKYLNTETRAGGFYAETVRKFRHTWKQVDNLKKEVNYKYELWEQKKILKYGDKAIIK